MKKIGYIEGIRAIATLIVLNNHFAALFLPTMLPYSKEPAHYAAEKLFSTTPLFALFNGQTAVMLFFMISGFVISHKYYKSNMDHNVLTRTAVRRYFTLVLPCLFSVIVGYVIVRFSLTSANQVNPNYLIWSIHPNFKEAVYQGILGIFKGSEATYNVALWTIQYEITGTFLVLGILALFGKTRIRYVVYTIVVLFWKKDFYSCMLMCFVIGMALYDIKQSRITKVKIVGSRIVHILIFVTGVILSVYPVYISNKHAYLYSIMQKLVNNNTVLYNIMGATLLFFVFMQSNVLKKVLESRVLLKFGELSFAIYVIHLAIFGTISSKIYLALREFASFNVVILATCISSYCIIYLFALGVHKLIVNNGIHLTNYICSKALPYSTSTKKDNSR